MTLSLAGIAALIQSGGTGLEVEEEEEKRVLGLKEHIGVWGRD